MRRRLATSLLLAAVALSSSALLVQEQQPLRIYDNIRNRIDSRNIFYTIFCKEAIGTVRTREVLKLCRFLESKELERDNNERMRVLVARDDGEGASPGGHRQEQWHNYPRRLDRLQPVPFERHKPAHRKRTPDPEDRDLTDEVVPEYINDLTKERLAKQNLNKIYDAILASADPLLLLDIRLAGLIDRNSNLTKNPEFMMDDTRYPQYTDDQDELLSEEINPVIEVVRVNSDDIPNILESETLDSPAEVPAKRMFSLWSRLQGLAHERGHQLHHRRHLHTFMHPDLRDLGDLTLTAETRAFMRPPGSPLRWG
ncbi:uncharacterized protein LOC105386169 [Plutella xylostella]|uniref:uncharacterized protein LOC105386169 n=1 Tax=Plutella xylostella TaxID=51655 RepID=UPI0020324264|nr:uncharacterized protein LOC105386169 [Plutella xylostella]